MRNVNVHSTLGTHMLAIFLHHFLAHKIPYLLHEYCLLGCVLHSYEIFPDEFVLQSLISSHQVSVCESAAFSQLDLWWRKH